MPFVFNEMTADFQDATIQGELTYRISDPKRIAALLDFSLDARGRYRSSDAEKLNDRLVHAAQILARSFTQRHTLAELLVSSDALVQEMIEKLKACETVTMLGVEVLALSIVSIKAAPEMAKALQADAREQLLQKADEAVFVRRNAALELERKIKENELNTEIAVEQKKRQIRETQMEAEIAIEQKKRQVRETQMEADVAIEQQRSQLVEHRVENQTQGGGGTRSGPASYARTAERHGLADADGGIVRRSQPQAARGHGVPRSGGKRREDRAVEHLTRSA